jgi:hypothetical protein
MIRHSRALISILLLGSLLFLAACGGDDDSDSDGDDAPNVAATTASTTSAGGSSGGSSGGGSNGDSDRGSVTIGDETIEFESARCFLQEQDVSGSPGKILLTGQGFGTNAAGESLTLDFTRFDEDSNFTGDDVTIDVGPLSYIGVADLGTVQRDGDTLSATGLELSDFGANETATVDFVLKC